MSQDMRNLINRFQRLINESTSEIDESGYSSIANTFRGLRPSIKKLAILTAENPHGEEHSDEFNKSANWDLERFLVQGKFGFKKVKGSYGSKENSYIVFNISYGMAVSIGVRFNQDSIIYGEVEPGADEEGIPMSFKMIGTDKTKSSKYREILGQTDVFVNRENAEDLYSEINGKKFVLPFYDVVDRLVDKNGKTFDLTKNYKGSKWEGGKVEPTSQVIKYVEDELNDLQERAMNTVGSTSYNLRSRIKEILEG